MCFFEIFPDLFLPPVIYAKVRFFSLLFLTPWLSIFFESARYVDLSLLWELLSCKSTCQSHGHPKTSSFLRKIDFRWGWKTLCSRRINTEPAEKSSCELERKSNLNQDYFLIHFMACENEESPTLARAIQMSPAIVSTAVCSASILVLFGHFLVTFPRQKELTLETDNLKPRNRRRKWWWWGGLKRGDWHANHGRKKVQGKCHLRAPKCLALPHNEKSHTMNKKVRNWTV